MITWQKLKDKTERIKPALHFTQSSKNLERRPYPSPCLRNSTTEWLRDINDDILCLVCILTGCTFRERRSPTGHPLILFKGCLLSQERQSKVCVKKIPLNKVDVWNKNWSKVTAIFIFPRVPSIWIFLVRYFYLKLYEIQVIMFR